MGMLERRPWLLSLALLLLVLLWMLVPSGTDSSVAEDRMRATRTLQTVQVSDIARESLTLRLSMTGQTRADATARLSSELDALLDEFVVKRGERVNKGDPIATLSTGSLKTALSSVKAERARARLAFDTVNKLASQGVSTEQEKATAWATLQAARAREDEISKEIAKSTIKAPFTGVVADLLVEQGDFVGIGQTVALVISVDPLIAAGDVSERDVSSLSVGDPATVTLLGDRELQGRVSYISPVADDATRTFSVEVSLPNEDLSVPVGMTSQIVIELDTVMAHRLSPALLTLSASGDIEVATVDDADRVALHSVDIVYSEASGVWVDGVPEGQRVITRGQGFVREGDSVNPVATRLIFSDAAGSALPTSGVVSQP